MNNKYKADFAVTQNNGVVTQIGRTVLMEPKTQHKGAVIKWFDDEKLRKK